MVLPKSDHEECKETFQLNCSETKLMADNSSVRTVLRRSSIFCTESKFHPWRGLQSCQANMTLLFAFCALIGSSEHTSQRACQHSGTPLHGTPPKEALQRCELRPWLTHADLRSGGWNEYIFHKIHLNPLTSCWVV